MKMGGFLFQQIVVIVPKLQRDVVVERQMKGKAAKSAPCLQYRHSLDNSPIAFCQDITVSSS